MYSSPVYPDGPYAWMVLRLGSISLVLQWVDGLPLVMLAIELINPWRSRPIKNAVRVFDLPRAVVSAQFCSLCVCFVNASSLVCQMCHHEAQSLSHLLEHTRDHTGRRDTRSHLTQPPRPKHSVLALLCGYGHDRSSQQHTGGSRSEAPAQGERERAEGDCGAARNSLGRAGPQERARNQGSQRRVGSPLLDCFQRGAAQYERRCRRPLFRSKFKQAFGYIETVPT